MIELSANIYSYLTKHFGEYFANEYKKFVGTEFTSYIRLSGNSSEQEKITNRLSTIGIQLHHIENVSNAYQIISGKELISKTLEYILGKYYIQSLSSMIPSMVVDPNENEIVLDMCAAPGSKSTQISEMMNNRGVFYANEASGQRIKSLVFNLDKTNIVNMGVLQFHGELLSKYFQNYFDKILVDAPCSGLGIVQKRGEVSNWWNEKQVSNLVEAQWKLLVGAIKAAKVGAEIIYSTCTMTIEENELLINKLLKKYPVELETINLPIKSNPAFTKYENENLNPELSKARRIIPWEINSEGFFICKLRKFADSEPINSASVKDRGIEILSYKNKNISKLLSDIETRFGIDFEHLAKFKYINKNNDLFFVDEKWNAPNPNIFTRIGTRFGSIDKNGNCILNSLAAQFFSKNITQSIIELNDDTEFQTYMQGGIIKKIIGSGQKVIRYRDYIIGTAVASKDGLKSQFPRAMRMQQNIL